MTERHLHCSNPSDEVNHGVLLVGYGSVGDGASTRGGESKRREQIPSSSPRGRKRSSPDWRERLEK